MAIALTGCGLNSDSPSPSVDTAAPQVVGSLSLQLAADPAEHAGIVALALRQPSRNVLIDGAMVAQWFPIAKDSYAAKTLAHDAPIVTRQVEGRNEILLLVGEHDVRQEHVLSMATGGDTYNGYHIVSVKLKPNMAYRTLLPLSTHRDEYCAISVDGEVYVVEKIRGLMEDSFQILTTSEQQAKDIVAAVANGR